MTDTASETCVMVVTTSDREEELHSIAAKLIEAQLAACCQIVGPITSHYVWAGKTERATEWQCLVKTKFDCYEQVESLIRTHHHYDEPEIIYFRIDGGSAGYLDWIKSQTDVKGDH